MSIEERKVQLGVEVDATGARQGFDHVKASARDMAQAVGQAGREAGKGMDGIGAGGDESAKKVDRATRSIIASIQRTTAVMEAGDRGSARYFETLATQRGVSPDALKPYLAQLEAAHEKQKLAQGSLDGMGISAKQMANNLRGVPAQFTDIATSLAGGQKPLTVFLQQGGQLKDMFGGAGNAARALGGYVVGLINPFTVTAAAATALGMAFYQGSEESRALAKSLLLTGNAAGTTVGQLQAVSRAVSQTTGATQGAAASALGEVVESGKVAAGNFQRVAEAAIVMERATGRSVAETVKQFAELGRSPVEASLKLNDQYRYLTAEIYRQIKALEDQGRASEAAALAQKSYADALADRGKNVIGNLGLLETAWHGVKKSAASAWDAMLGIGRSDSPDQKVSELSSRINNLRDKLDRQRTLGGGVDNSRKVASIQRELAAALQQQAVEQEGLRLENRAAEAAGRKATKEQANIKWLKDGEEYRTRQQKMAAEILRMQTEGVAAGRSQLEIDQRIALVREKFAVKTPKEQRNDFEQSIRANLTGINARETSDAASAGAYAKDDIVGQIDAIQRLRDVHVEASAARAAQLGLLAQAQTDVGQKAKTLAEIDKEGALAAGLGIKARNDVIAIQEELARVFGESIKQQYDQIAALTLSGDALAGYQQARSEATAAEKEALATRLASKALDADEAGDTAEADRYWAASEAARQYANTIRDLGKLKADAARGASVDSAFGDMASSASQLDQSLGGAIAGFGKLIKAQRDYNKDQQKSIRDQVNGYGDIAGAMKGMFKQHSAGYKTMEAVEKGARLLELGLAVKNAATQLGLIGSVTAAKVTGEQLATNAAVQGVGARVAASAAEGQASAIAGIAGQAKGDPYTAWVRMAAMAATMAALGYVVSGAGKSGGGSPAIDLEAIQAGQGTGTVLGDATAKSESIAKAMELLGDVNTMTMRYSAQMADSLHNIEANMRGFATLLVRGIGGGAIVDVPTGSRLEVGNDLLTARSQMLNNPITKYDIVMRNDDKNFQKLVGGLFGETSSYQANSGVDLAGGKIRDYINQQISLRQFQTVVTTTESWFDSDTSVDTYYAGLNGEVYRQVSAMFTGLADSMAAAAGALKLDPAAMFQEVLNASLTVGQVSLQGLSGQAAQDAIAAVFSAAFDRVAVATLPELLKFQQVGEGYYQTIIRVAAGYDEAGSVLETLGVGLVAFGAVSDKLAADIGAEFVRDSILAYDALLNLGAGISEIIAVASGGANEVAGLYRELDNLRTTILSWGLDGSGVGINMVRGAGGLDPLSQGIGAYEENFLSEAERAIAETARVAHEFARLGQVMPDTRAEFRAMVEALDLGTAAGQQAFGELMQLSPAFAHLTEILDGTVRQDEIDALKRTIDQFDRLTESLTEFRESLWKAPDSGLSASSRYDLANAEFLRTSALASSGDTRALGDLDSVIGDFLEASKAVSHSAVEAMRDRARADAALAAAIAYTGGMSVQANAALALIPQFADGGYHAGGARLVGENGPELEITGPSHIVNNANTRSLFDLSALIAKVETLRVEVQSGNVAIARTNAEIASTVRQWNGDGLPETRVLA